MDLESQGRIKQVLDQAGTQDVIAVLGANSPAAVEMVATTLQSGDPSYAGPLAGVALGIPSYHVLEPEIAKEIDPGLYERELALTAMVMDVDEVTAPLKSLRTVSPN
jgi:glycine reductase